MVYEIHIAISTKKKHRRVARLTRYEGRYSCDRGGVLLLRASQG